MTVVVPIIYQRNIFPKKILIGLGIFFSGFFNLFVGPAPFLHALFGPNLYVLIAAFMLSTSFGPFVIVPAINVYE